MLNMTMFINLKQTLIHIPAIVKPHINKTNEEIFQAHVTAILNIFLRFPKNMIISRLLTSLFNDTEIHLFKNRIFVK